MAGMLVNPLSQVGRVIQQGQDLNGNGQLEAASTNSDLIASTSYGGGAAINSTRTWDDGGRLAGIEWAVGNTTVDGRQYLLDAMGRRTQATMADAKKWTYGYDTRGQVTDAARKDAAGAPLIGSRWGYEYDTIGNRINSTERSVADDSLMTTTYDSSATNAYSARHVPDPAHKPVRGRAHADSSVLQFLHRWQLSHGLSISQS